MGKALGAAKCHKGVVQGVQVGCTCRLVPSNGSWVGCTDGFGEELEYFGHRETPVWHPPACECPGSPNFGPYRWTVQT